MQRIIVAIPCYNEEQTIGKVVADFRNSLSQGEIIVYDNCSTDNTAEIARAAGAKVRSVPMRGKGRTIRQIFSDFDSDILIIADGDDTYPSAEVATLLAPIINGEFDMMVGDRISSTYFSENKRPFHNWGNTLITKMTNWIFGTHLNDVLSGYRVFNRKFVDNATLLSDGFEIETEITAFALSNGYRIGEVPVTYRDRTAGSVSKLHTFSDGWRIIKALVTLFRDYRPLAFFSCTSLFLAVVSLIFLVPVFVDYFNTGLVERFPTLIFGCFIMSASILSLGVGLILQVIVNQNRRISQLLSK